jgi:hypothetical protein
MNKIYYVLQKRTEGSFFNVGIVDDIELAKAWVEMALALGYRRFDTLELNKEELFK